MNANDYVEIMWGTPDNKIEIASLVTPYSNSPSIPSVIATLTQV